MILDHEDWVILDNDDWVILGHDDWMMLVILSLLQSMIYRLKAKLATMYSNIHIRIRASFLLQLKLALGPSWACFLY